MEIKDGKIGEVYQVDTSMALIPYENKLLYNNITELLYKGLKRSVDIACSIVGIISLIPLTVLIFFANIFSKDRGPIFYTQERIGKDGKIFKMYKFRSMVVGADKKLEQYLRNNKEAREEYDLYKKLKYDPRITKVGKFIRMTSIDEFPQFINVLKGDMSLVGPRPYLEREKEDMLYYYKYIISHKPGITGYWQISGRSNVTFNDRLKMDMEYYHNNSIKSDIKIISKTLISVLWKKGAV